MFIKLKKNIPCYSKKLYKIEELYLTFIKIKKVKNCIDFAIEIKDPILTIFIKVENLAIFTV